ncbi:hypothetical protein GOM49_10040 [Clostridium bovifaecis]|uniref:Uncharacterized protein n=1 Tax=Clostridium bovifaecis TaxID=2184719 RepID=A0A6I6F2E3_9CLOT|nr:hypothetical protein GOM49_10040 [Clostridium bovifaecis]
MIPSTSEEGNKDIIVISGQDYNEGITSAFYAAHKGTPILFVQQNKIPNSIKSFISNNTNKNYYIFQLILQNMKAQLIPLAGNIIKKMAGHLPLVNLGSGIILHQGFYLHT